MSEGHQYTDELRQVKVDLGELRQDLRKFIESQQVHNQEIKQLLAGSEYGEDGLVKKQIKLEERVEALETLKNKMYGYALALGGSGGGAIYGILKLLES